jgi:hypothetical protein
MYIMVLHLERVYDVWCTLCELREEKQLTQRARSVLSSMCSANSHK